MSIEELPDGKKVTRGIDGKFQKVELDSETAAAMSRARWDKEKGGTIDSLLLEAGFDPPKSAPEHIRILAKYATSGRSGAVSAMRDFLRLTKQDSPDYTNYKYEPGTPCPVCSKVTIPIYAGDGVIDITPEDIGRWYAENQPSDNANLGRTKETTGGKTQSED